MAALRSANEMLLRSSCARLTHSVRALSTPAMERHSHAASLEPLRTQLLPELYPPSKNDEDRFDHTKVLIRTETTILRNELITPYTKPLASTAQVALPNLVLLDGLNGVGKSTITAHTVAHARHNGFIVAYIPEAQFWTDGPGFFCPVLNQGLNIMDHGMDAVRYYDRPLQTGAIFTNLLELHANMLAKLPCTPSLATEDTAKCQTLHDLVLRGNTLSTQVESDWRINPSLAADVLHQLLLELSANKEVPFALVIDNYHSFVGMTCMVDDRKRRIHSNGIRTIAQFLGRDSIERFAANIQNGFVLLTSEEYPQVMECRRSRVLGGTEFPLGEHILKDPSGRAWLKGLRKRVADPDNHKAWYISVPDCIPGELKAMCATFSPRGLRRDSTQGENRGIADRLVALAGGRGAVMKKIFTTR